MTLHEAAKEILTRQTARLEPLYIPRADWEKLQKELQEMIGFPPLCNNSGYMNFLLCGVEVRPK